jgi:PEGA domain
MSLLNLVSDNPGRDARSNDTTDLGDFPIEPGFLLEDQAPGLESFGSEDDDAVANASAGRGDESRVHDETDAADVRRWPVEIQSREVTPEENPLLPEHVRQPKSAALPALLTQVGAGFASAGNRAGTGLRKALLPALRWSHAHLKPRIAFAILVTIVGIGEVGWMGLRAAKELKEFLADDGTDAAMPSVDQLDGSKVASSESPVLVSVQSSPPSVPPRNSNVPGWVAISAPVPVEILERGRVIGASWNGGVRLAPGRHNVRIVNRTNAIDVQQSLDIAAGSTTSVAVELRPGSVQINAVPSASVRIDGKAVGNTPVMDLELAGGPHEVLFSHPRLGERRMTINVVFGKPLKLSTDLRR